jgi:hypothetical protein
LGQNTLLREELKESQERCKNLGMYLCGEERKKGMGRAPYFSQLFIEITNSLVFNRGKDYVYD